LSIIWKWDAEVPNLPKNVKISSWLPQQDLLGHPNLKVFVTHGGLGSLVEAIYHKAVIVGIPFSADQRPNLLRAVRNGYARMLEWEDLTSEDLINGIKDAMNDANMEATMERIHNLYMDREKKPLEKAAWWVEYVCRHKGATMLQSRTEDIPWYQYHHVDIIIFLAGIIFCMLAGFVVSCKICRRICCGKKIKTE
jgi:glucuronosyltransferase